MDTKNPTMELLREEARPRTETYGKAIQGRYLWQAGKAEETEGIKKLEFPFVEIENWSFHLRNFSSLELILKQLIVFSKTAILCNPKTFE